MEIALSVVVLFIFWISIYGYIHKKEQERLQEIWRQMPEADGNEEGRQRL